MRGILFVALGGALGSVARYLVGLGMSALFGSAFPWGTLTVNLVGSFAIGIVARLVAAQVWAPMGDGRLFVAVGILGGFTTFSSFTIETFGLIRQGTVALAFTYVLVSIVLGLVFAAAGYAAPRGL